MVAALRRVEVGLDRRQRVACGERLGAHRSDRLLELVELALPGEHAMEIAVRREEMDRLRRDEMPLRRDERLADRERPPIAQAPCSDVAAATHAAKPVLEQARYFRTLAPDTGEQAVRRRRLSTTAAAPVAGA